ncbi:S-adenosyl-L-methionine-dependent methyltransferase [Hypoxylon sp. FL1150]|nr:S-adenosyl-L-methionine-dependent methyltransferase [Hypoxylon sp. FL1150]
MNFRARLSSYVEPIQPLKVAVWALYVTIWDAIRAQGIKAIAGAGKWRHDAFSLWFRTLSPHFIRMERASAVPKLVASAEGTILELGPGLGNQIPVFDRAKVGHIYGIEINGSFVPDLQAQVAECGLDGKYTVVHCGVEDADVLEEHGIKPGTIDSIVSIQVFCSASQPDAVAKEMYRLLKPGGKLIFWEHHKCQDFVTWIFQTLWNISWSFLVGCEINRDIISMLKSAGTWENVDSIETNEQNRPWGLMPRSWGVLIKADEK